MADDLSIALPEGWPRMSLEAVRQALTAPGQRFEMETIDIRGVPTRIWKHAPPNLSLLTRMARGYGDRIFTVYEDERISYEANYRAIVRLAAEMQAMGIGKGDRVALAMRNLPEWPAIFFAILGIGAVAVPLNAWWTSGEIDFGLRDSGARMLFVDAERHARLKASYDGFPALMHVIVARDAGPLDGKAIALADLIGQTRDWAGLEEAPFPQGTIAPEDDAAIFYTSGTTGAPKGAIISHRNFGTNILSAGYSAARAMLRRGEIPSPEPEPQVGLLVIPLFHVTACSAAMMLMIATGGTMIFMRKWDAVAAMEIIQRERVQTTGGVPTIAWQLLEHPDRADYDLSSLDTISYGGAPSAPELVRRIHAEFGALPGNGWGMTETTATVTHHLGEDYLSRPTSCGLPVPVADLKIVDAARGVEQPVGDVGELWARGPMIVRGYWNRPDETAQTFVDGWVRTGDLARLDADGFCYIVDRAKDIVIRGGENIYSSEVEDVLYAHPAVTDAALIGLPHRTLGEEPAAVVHLAPGSNASEAELQDWVRARLAAFKVPTRIRFVPSILPRNANGKIMKTELRRMFGAESAD